jgi:hypothetical protein
MYAKVTDINISCGINSKIKSNLFLKYKALNPLSMMPSIIYMTPTITANFILKEFMKTISLPAFPHIGSNP